MGPCSQSFPVPGGVGPMRTVSGAVRHAACTVGTAGSMGVAGAGTTGTVGAAGAMGAVRAMRGVRTVGTAYAV